MDQDHIFAQGESDRYYQRNREHLGQMVKHADLPLMLLDLYGIRPESALEVGAANGYRLGWLRDRCGARCLAVEPSGQAIAEGQRMHPDVAYLQATAATMELPGTYDLVIVNYVFHWIERANLLESVARIDRAVKDGGYLLIGDFAPANRTRVPYKHREGLYTYKQDYARLFLETGLYHAVAMLTSSHGALTLDPNVPEQERYGVTLLQKHTSAHYADVTL